MQLQQQQVQRWPYGAHRVTCLAKTNLCENYMEITSADAHHPPLLSDTIGLSEQTHCSDAQQVPEQ